MQGMKLECGVWLPEHEQHLQKWMNQINKVVDGKLTYQYHKLEAALSYVKDWNAAIDIGAHCGLWSRHLAKRFSTLYAFEPIELHRACFEKNVQANNVVLIPHALGEEQGLIKMHTTKGSSGDSWVEGKGSIPMRRLDDEWDEMGGLQIDFIKIDCEGYELHALRGGEKLLLACRPVVIVEQKPGKAETFGLERTAAVSYLQGLGAKLHREMSGDYILAW